MRKTLQPNVQNIFPLNRTLENVAKEEGNLHNSIQVHVTKVRFLKKKKKSISTKYFQESPNL